MSKRRKKKHYNARLVSLTGITYTPIAFLGDMKMLYELSLVDKLISVKENAFSVVHFEFTD